MYSNGQGVDQSDERAKEYYEAAAKQGHAGAQCNLGILYYSGQGVEESNEKARALWMKAAEQGQENAIKKDSKPLTNTCMKEKQHPPSFQNPLNVHPATDHTIHQNTNSDHAMDVIEFITAEENVK